MAEYRVVGSLKLHIHMPYGAGGEEVRICLKGQRLGLDEAGQLVSISAWCQPNRGGLTAQLPC